MADSAVKKRRARAVKRAADILIGSNYIVTFLQSEVFNLEAMREREIRKIRVVIDAIGYDDESKVKSLRVPAFCTKETWCKRFKEAGFRVREIR